LNIRFAGKSLNQITEDELNNINLDEILTLIKTRLDTIDQTKYDMIKKKFKNLDYEDRYRRELTIQSL